jgi:hypothetical protein
MGLAFWIEMAGMAYPSIKSLYTLQFKDISTF